MCLVVVLLYLPCSVVLLRALHVSFGGPGVTVALCGGDDCCIVSFY